MAHGADSICVGSPSSLLDFCTLREFGRLLMLPREWTVDGRSDNIYSQSDLAARAFCKGRFSPVRSSTRVKLHGSGFRLGQVGAALT
jgi:hypothetical protein